MLFNSFEFAIFLPIVFGVYWLIPSKRIRSQNFILLIASYLFYGWWDWRFLSLIFISTIIDFVIGKKLNNESIPTKRKLLLWTSLAMNFGFLGVFKYYNFFVDNFVQAFSFFGHSFHSSTINIILPVGISFYTFQTVSYTIDIYRKKLQPATDIIAFGTFVSFFPQLVAGPIERATNFLPQFHAKRKFDYSQSVNGLRQILWGLFKKIVIADNCAEYVNLIFNNSTEYSGSTLIVGAILFAFQIYGDFSGYSDIAIGTSRLFGFNLKRNFAFPYFSRDIAEFWRRWHISLSTWFRDYLYIPLGGSKGSSLNKIRNVFIIFLVSGFWHGANWTFIVWGALNAVFFLPLLLRNKNRNNQSIVAQGKLLPSFQDLIRIGVTFTLTTFAWIIFRAENMSHALSYINEIFSLSTFTKPELLPRNTFALILFFIVIEWIGREKEFGLAFTLNVTNTIARRSIYYIVILLIILFGSFSDNEFIYFQF